MAGSKKSRELINRVKCLMCGIAGIINFKGKKLTRQDYYR